MLRTLTLEHPGRHGTPACEQFTVEAPVFRLEDFVRLLQARQTLILLVRIGRRLDGAALSELDDFLTARWALGTRFGRRLMWAQVEHPAWPIHEVELLGCDESLFTAAGLGPPGGEVVARWSPGVEVRIERPRAVSL